MTSDQTTSHVRDGKSADAKSDSRALRVLLVGHCVPDSYLITGVVRRALPGATVERINDAASLDAARGAAGVGDGPGDQRPCLLLVNRVLDGEFGDESGVNLIETMHRAAGGRSKTGPVCILISNFADAQEAAVKAGAMPGVGKSDLSSDAALQRLLGAAERAAAASR